MKTPSATPGANALAPTEADRVSFAYADIGSGSRNLALGCDLTRAIDAEILYCVGPADVEAVVGRHRGPFVLFTNFSMKPSRVPTRGLARLGNLIGFAAGDAVPAALKQRPHHAAAFRFLRDLLQRHPDLHVHVVTEARRQAVPNEIANALSPDGRATLQRVQQFGIPMDWRKFITFVLDRLEKSYGHRRFERREWAISYRGPVPQGLRAAELAFRHGYAGEWGGTMDISPDESQAPVAGLADLSKHLCDTKNRPDYFSDREFSLLWADNFSDWRFGYGLLACARSFPNCRYYHASENKEALHIAEANPIDVLVTNVREGVLEFIRQFQREHPQTRVIVCSSVISEAPVLACGALLCNKKFFFGPHPDFFGLDLTRLIHALITGPAPDPGFQAMEKRCAWRSWHPLPERLPASPSPQAMEKRLRDGLASREANPAALRWELAQLYNATGRLDEAIQELHRLLEIESEVEKRAACLLALGQTLEKKQDYRAAIGHYRAALRLEPGHETTWYFIHNNLGYCLNQTGEHSEAERFCQQAVDIQPGRHNAYKNLGVVRARLGRSREAVEAFLQAVHLNAGDPQTLVHLEELLTEQPALQQEFEIERDLCRDSFRQAKFAIWSRLCGYSSRLALGSADPTLAEVLKKVMADLHGENGLLGMHVATAPEQMEQQFAAWGCTLMVLHPRSLFPSLGPVQAQEQGLDLIRHLKRRHVCPILIFIEETDIERCHQAYLSLGVDVVLKWPVQLNALMDALRQVTTNPQPP